MDIITSSQNSLIKTIKALKSKKYRDEKKMFFIEGIRFAEEAIKADAEIIAFIFSDKLMRVSGGNEIASKIQKKGYAIHTLSERLFGEISDTGNPQGILAIVRQKKYELGQLLVKNNFLIILDSIQDPGNMGTIIRTADAAGATGVILSKGCVDLYNPKVLRSTMGSNFHIRISAVDNLTEAMNYLKNNGVKVCTTHLKGSVDYFDADLRNNIALVIGNEANGVNAETVNQSDLLVRIPMPGMAESLNASVAAGLIIYEAVRQRIKLGI